MTEQHHIIWRQTCEVEMQGSETDGLKWQRSISDFTKDVLVKELETTFDRLCPTNSVWRIEKINLIVDIQKNDSHWEQAMSWSIGHQLNEILSNTEGSRSVAEIGAIGFNQTVQRLSSTESIIDQFLYFLEFGQLPWYSRKVESPSRKAAVEYKSDQALSHNDFESLLIQSLHQQPLLLKWKDTFLRLLQKKEIRERIIFQFSNETIQQILFYFFPGKITEEDSMKIKGNDANESWQKAFDRLVTPEEAVSENQTENKIYPPKPNPDGDHWFIQNAGLVILHPFISILFDTVGVSEKGELIDTDKGVHLLQYLATSQESTPEHNLTLNKVLCGIPIHASIRKNIQLLDSEKAEARILLEAAIKHWAILKNSTIENLQGSFLCREGKLTQKQNGDWLLQVETKGWDVLMEQLPWMISMIKLPWMENMLMVEW